jgi:hypothetical protein
VAPTTLSSPKVKRANVLQIRLTNVRRATVHPRRAKLTCKMRVKLRSDGPAAVKLAGCHRTVRRR